MAEQKFSFEEDTENMAKRKHKAINLPGTHAEMLREVAEAHGVRLIKVACAFIEAGYQEWKKRHEQNGTA